MNPYETVFNHPDLILWYASVLLLLVAWVFLSYRKLFKWYNSIAASAERWEFFLLPPDDVTGDIFWFAVVVAVNLFIIGGFLHIVIV